MEFDLTVKAQSQVRGSLGRLTSAQWAFRVNAGIFIGNMALLVSMYRFVASALYRGGSHFPIASGSQQWCIKFPIFHYVMQGHEGVLCSVVALQGLKMYFSPSSAGWQDCMSVTFWIRFSWYQFQSGPWHKCFCVNPLVTRLVLGLMTVLRFLPTMSAFLQLLPPFFSLTLRKLWLSKLMNSFPIYCRASQNYVLILKPAEDLQVCVNCPH